MKRLIVAFALFLTACVSASAPRESLPELIPVPVARSILAEYFGESWVQRPTGLAVSVTCAVQRGGVLGYFGGYPLVDLPFERINRVYLEGTAPLLGVGPRGQSTGLTVAAVSFWGATGYANCQNAHVWHTAPGQFTEDDAQRVASALRALGARVREN